MKLEEVLADEYTRCLETQELYFVTVPAIFGHQVIKSVCAEPTNQVINAHLKRARKNSGSGVDILLGNTAQLPKSLEELLKAQGHALIISPITVPLHGPRTAEQFKCWSQMWPLVFRKSPPPPLDITEHSVHEALVSVLEDALRLGGPSVPACIITYKGAIIGQAIDKRHCHPLKHAVINAIEDVSNNVLKSRHNLSKHAGNKSLKRSGAYLNCDSTGAYLNNCDSTGSNHSTLPIESNLTSDSAFPTDLYLCTGCIAFVTHEPCVMCSMALLHSRISCVVYSKKNTEFGGLGSQAKLHTMDKLNHTFQVMRTVM